MVFSDVLGVLRRRWYAVAVGLLATIGLGYVAALASPPTYTARGLVLLVPSQEIVGKGGNPLLVMDGLTLPATVLVAYYKGAAAQADVAAHAPTASFEVTLDESTRGPVIAIDVSDPSAAGAIQALDYLAEAVPARLDTLQKEVDAPPESVVTSLPLTMDTEATADTSSATRMLIAAVGVGLVATLLLTSMLDGLLLRLQRAEVEAGHRPRLRAADAADEDDEEGDDRPPSVRRKAR